MLPWRSLEFSFPCHGKERAFKSRRERQCRRSTVGSASPWYGEERGSIPRDGLRGCGEKSGSRDWLKPNCRVSDVSVRIRSSAYAAVVQTGERLIRTESIRVRFPAVA